MIADDEDILSEKKAGVDRIPTDEIPEDDNIPFDDQEGHDRILTKEFPEADGIPSDEEECSDQVPMNIYLETTRILRLMMKKIMTKFRRKRCQAMTKFL